MSTALFTITTRALSRGAYAMRRMMAARLRRVSRGARRADVQACSQPADFALPCFMPPSACRERSARSQMRYAQPFLRSDAHADGAISEGKMAAVHVLDAARCACARRAAEAAMMPSYHTMCFIMTRHRSRAPMAAADYACPRKMRYVLWQRGQKRVHV